MLFTTTIVLSSFFSFFFFNDTATTEIYTLSLHDALPISRPAAARGLAPRPHPQGARPRLRDRQDRRPGWQRADRALGRPDAARVRGRADATHPPHPEARLHEPLQAARPGGKRPPLGQAGGGCRGHAGNADRKSTRLNSSHLVISYAVFCLKKKNAH